jgi:hypothetical protein
LETTVGLESLLLIVVVVEAVWILSGLFRGAEDDRQRRPMGRAPGQAPPRQRQAPSNVDRFLEEVNRRRQAAQRQAGAARVEKAPIASMPARTEQPLPSTGAVLAVPVSDRDQGRYRRIRAEPIAKVEQPIEAVVVVDESSPRSGQRVSGPLPGAPGSTGNVAVPAAAGVSVSAVASAGKARPVSPFLAQLLPMVQSRQALRNAILLQEIFGQPLSRRKRRHRPA